MGASRWDRETIAVCILTFWKDYGHPPSEVDWNPAKARALGHNARARRFEEADWPSSSTVRRHFGSWSAAIAEVGFDTPKPGKPEHLTRQVILERGYR